MSGKKKCLIGWMARKTSGQYAFEVYKSKRLALSIWGRSNICKVKIEELK